MARILIIDDDSIICHTLRLVFSDMGHEVQQTLTLSEGLAEAGRNPYDVVYLDVDLPDGNGLEALPRISDTPSSPEVVIITGVGGADGAALAIKNGAWDYIQKPASLEAMKLPLIRALQYRAEKTVTKSVPVALKREGIIGNSSYMKRCMDFIAQAASSEANVLIQGETGTGKELCARAIHENSERVRGPFIVVDCSILTENLVESILFGHNKGAFTGADKQRIGLIKQADGGTLFLDEVGELPLVIQRGFLRVLQERRFRPVGEDSEVSSDFRLIAATNKTLSHMARDGLFRSDLLFRLQTLTIEIPSLRNRDRDVRELCLHYMAAICHRYTLPPKGFSLDFFDFLERYPWPGNVRELVNAMENSIVSAGEDQTLYPKHLPVHIRISVMQSGMVQSVKPEGAGQFDELSQTASPPLSWETYKQQYFQSLMTFTGYDIKKACELSGLNLKTLYRCLKKHQVPTKK